ncbi:MAG: hypothetical protein DCE92_13340 [Alphaproteobacteria bacterium]|nr:MAG: hypothetical protein DCE92_13340 [Alphaproteobacteria bacterium]
MLAISGAVRPPAPWVTRPAVMVARPGFSAGSAEDPPLMTSWAFMMGRSVERATMTLSPLGRVRSAITGAAFGRSAPRAGRA